jgi:hypothetical protein
LGSLVNMVPKSHFGEISSRPRRKIGKTEGKLAKTK